MQSNQTGKTILNLARGYYTVLNQRKDIIEPVTHKPFTLNSMTSRFIWNNRTSK